MEANLKLNKLDMAEVDIHNYQSMTGSAMYVIVENRVTLKRSGLTGV
jgi:hypothetical protein